MANAILWMRRVAPVAGAGCEGTRVRGALGDRLFQGRVVLCARLAKPASHPARSFRSEHDCCSMSRETGEKELWAKPNCNRFTKCWSLTLGVDGEPARPTAADTYFGWRLPIEGCPRIRLSDGARLDVTAPLPLIDKAMAALRTCEVELAGHWGVAPADMAGWATTALSASDIRAMFWNPDPRASVLLRHPVRALLEIDALGAVTDCRIVKSSKVSWVDDRFCATLRQRRGSAPRPMPAERRGGSSSRRTLPREWPADCRANASTSRVTGQRISGKRTSVKGA